MGLSPLRFFECIVILILAVVLIYLFAVRSMQFFEVPSSSMEPTLVPGDHLMTLAAETYGYGDIVVFRDPVRQDEYLVKRIVASGGDSVEISGGALFVNGEYVSEPYIAEPSQQDFPPYEVPERQVFVLGDNRNAAEDSSVWGHGITLESIEGRVRAIYLPFSRSRWVNQVARVAAPAAADSE